MSQFLDHEEIFRGRQVDLRLSDLGLSLISRGRKSPPPPQVARYEDVARPALAKRSLQIAFIDGRPDWTIPGLPQAGAQWAYDLIERGAARAKLRQGPLFTQKLSLIALKDQWQQLAAADEPDPFLLGQSIIHQAILHHASDLHFLPSRVPLLGPRASRPQPSLGAPASRPQPLAVDAAPRLLILFRLDGQLAEIADLPPELGERVLNSLKSSAHMPVYAATEPQTGRLTVNLEDRAVDIRLTSLPTAEGEKLAARLFDPAARPSDLATLGMEPEILQRYLDLIAAPQACVLFTGPAGAGKSTTMYASLLHLKSQMSWRHIATVEEPVELIVPGVQQTEVSRERGLDFAEVLRVILRQDPQVIMVGEIRDRETAEIAVQAGLTGHLIFSTVHAPDPVGVFLRLLELEVPPYLAASSVTAVMTQRLVRTLCPNCAAPYQPTADELTRAGLDPSMYERLPAASFRRAVGCDECLDGYNGRTGLFALLVVTEDLRRAVLDRRPAFELQSLAPLLPAGGLWEAGLLKASRGETSLDELLRVLGPRS